MGFHNGTVYYTGTHKNKMSMDYEVVRPGIASIAMKHQDIPVSLFVDSLQETINGGYRYGDVSLIEDVRTRVELELNGVVATTCAPYFDKHNRLMAVVGVQYITRPPSPEQILKSTGLEAWDSDAIFEKFQCKVNEIGKLL